MVADLALVGEVVADRLPRHAAVVGALHDLAEPARRLRRPQPVGLGRRAVDVVNLPTAEMWSTDLPVLAFAVGGQDERAFASANQQPYSSHARSFVSTLSLRPQHGARPHRHFRGQSRPAGPRTGEKQRSDRSARARTRAATVAERVAIPRR